MPTVFAPAIRTRKNLRHFPCYYRNLNEAAEGATEPDAVGLALRFATPVVRPTPPTLGED